jgi:hypothetical protein
MVKPPISPPAQRSPSPAGAGATEEIDLGTPAPLSALEELVELGAEEARGGTGGARADDLRMRLALLASR